MQQLEYNFEIYSVMKKYELAFQQTDVVYIEDFFRYLNHNCPLCQDRMVDRSNRMTKVGTIKIEVVPADKYALAYALCRDCSRKTAKTKSKALQKRNGEKIYSYISELLTP